jgi:hypothetical protein
MVDESSPPVRLSWAAAMRTQTLPTLVLPDNEAVGGVEQSNDAIMQVDDVRVGTATPYGYLGPEAVQLVADWLAMHVKERPVPGGGPTETAPRRLHFRSRCEQVMRIPPDDQKFFDSIPFRLWNEVRL